MTSALDKRRTRRWVAALACVAGLVTAAPSYAALAGPVTVSAIVPGGYSGDSADAFTLTDTIDLAVGIYVGDETTNIGSTASNFMLPGEFVRFNNSTNAIEAHIARGDPDFPRTGLFGDGTTRARYEFDGLDFAGKVIAGIMVYGFDGFVTLPGITGLAAGLNPDDFVSFDGNDRVTLFVDEALLFADRGNGSGEDFIEFRIDLLTRDIVDPPEPPNPTVPEPASAVLVLAALAALGWARRRSRPEA